MGVEVGCLPTNEQAVKGGSRGRKNGAKNHPVVELELSIHEREEENVSPNIVSMLLLCWLLLLLLLLLLYVVC